MKRPVDCIHEGFWCFDHENFAWLCWNIPHQCCCGSLEAHWYHYKGVPMCTPCAYGVHETCACSRPDDWTDRIHDYYIWSDDE